MPAIKFADISMRHVRIPTIAPTTVPTKTAQNISTLSPEDVADPIAHAIASKSVGSATHREILGDVMHPLSPRIAGVAMNTSFQVFPNSDAAKTRNGDPKDVQMRAAQIAS